MAAYMIVFAEVHDRARFFSDYAGPTAALLSKMGGEYVVRAPGVSALEGPLFDGQSAVISRWPSKEAALAFWNSPEYEALKLARQTLATAHVMLVEDPS
ncbi:MAG: DUF1330 domain-containing protein [Pseudomonadota bacterium]